METSKNRQEKMTQEQRESYKNLLKELEGENNNQVKQILQLALQLDEKGEFWKFIEVFGDGGIDDKMSSDCPDIIKIILNIVYGEDRITNI